jgi:superfamily I DNA/RNA helicase
MEYDNVHLANDFITEGKLEQLKEDKSKDRNTDKLNEEINLLYVAITRTRNNIHIPETLMPVNFPPSSQIHVTDVLKEEEKRDVSATGKTGKQKAVGGKK